MAIFTKLFCAFFGSIAGGCLLHAYFCTAKTSSSNAAFSVALGLFFGGFLGLEAGREILKDNPKPK